MYILKLLIILLNLIVIRTIGKNEYKMYEDYDWPRIKTLDLSNNRFENLDIMNILDTVPFTKTINLSYCNIKYIITSFKQFSNLEVLDLSNNNIQIFNNNTLINNNNLKILNLSYNKHVNRILRNIDNNNLERLIINNCRIHKIHNYMFKNIPNVKYIDLSYNNLKHIHYVVRSYTPLMIDLKFNRLTTINVYNIGSIIISCNNIKHVNDIELLKFFHNRYKIKNIKMDNPYSRVEFTNNNTLIVYNSDKHCLLI
ncbi:leucine rich repeat gene family protein [Alphaentomopoxvirus acuprea]|uniref:Leucine rich repeat gene family protein n=1 Tax=Alphaentomopoxvirus acuprea TaxID=62099 RepID=W6JLN8_9POXV|nr:leucine rich repeat gene family protein [Anomala cuprea entomopoxvirus]BAO49571.1 leucine rich repeat gene family protein [Anomala cuprea entomopoxvirus]